MARALGPMEEQRRRLREMHRRAQKAESSAALREAYADGYRDGARAQHESDMRVIEVLERQIDYLEATIARQGARLRSAKTEAGGIDH